MNHSVKSTVSSTIGTLVEWYDFFVYGLCATLIFPKIFFSDLDPALAIIIGYASYSIAFLFRPLGALSFGYFGDKYGRRNVLAWSLLLMGGSTVGIGLLPTYQSVGLIAPIALLVLRIIQGFAVGGEWGTASTVTYEHAPILKRGLAGGFIQVTIPLAVLASGAMVSLVASQGDAFLFDFGWRIPFLISAVMLFIGIYVRIFLPEAHEFKTSEKVRNPLLETFQQYKLKIIRIALARMFQNVMFNTITIFFITYMSTKLGVPKTLGLDAMMIGAGFSTLFIMGWAYTSDYVSRQLIMVLGAVMMILALPTMFLALSTASFVTIVSIFVGAFFCHDAMCAVQASLLPKQFPAKVRLTGTNLGYNLGGAFAGLASMLVPIILEWRGDIFDVVVFLTAIGMISAYNSYRLE